MRENKKKTRVLCYERLFHTAGQSFPESNAVTFLCAMLGFDPSLTWRRAQGSTKFCPTLCPDYSVTSRLSDSSTRSLSLCDLPLFLLVKSSDITRERKDHFFLWETLTNSIKKAYELEWLPEIWGIKFSISHRLQAVLSWRQNKANPSVIRNKLETRSYCSSKLGSSVVPGDHGNISVFFNEISSTRSIDLS